MTVEQLVQIYKVVTNVKVTTPKQEYKHVGDDYLDGPLQPADKQVAAMFRSIQGQYLKKYINDYRFSSVWSGHKAEHPNLFDEDDLKDDAKYKSKKAIASGYTGA